MKNKMIFSFAIGSNLWMYTTSSSGSNNIYPSFIFSPNFLIFLKDKQKHNFEIDIGCIIQPDNVSDDLLEAKYKYTPHLVGFIGYRYQKPSGGIMFKAGYVPYFGDIYNDIGFQGKDKVIQDFNIERILIKLPPFSDSDWIEIYNWIGISIGYAF